MEDHLQNKDRLREEWQALCAYVAEPNNSTVAQREENVYKNRCPAVLACRYWELRGCKDLVTGGAGLQGSGDRGWGVGVLACRI